MKIALVIVQSQTGEQGGAEKFFQGLHQAFENAGYDTKTIAIVSDESSFESIKVSYEKFKKLDLSDFDLVISTKAPSYAIEHPNHIIYLVHTMRVFYDMFDKEFPNANNKIKKFRKLIIDTDTKEFTKSGVAKLFTIGNEVSKRLKEYNHLDSEVLYPPLLKDNFYYESQQNYIFIPSRLHRWKRIDLIIKAMEYVKSDIKLHIAGTGEDENALKQMANNKVVFLGRISDEEIEKEYANALAVPFVPINEDYGYVTLEAFRSKKPVITCKDSGEPANLVIDEETGFVCEADPMQLANKIDFLYQNKQLAKQMGERGFESISHITWDRVVKNLVNASNNYDEDVLVLDMQPIDPPVGGGRLRLLGLYHNLGADLNTLYIGSYDWRGESFRDHMLSDTLREIDIPLSDEHFKESEALSSVLGYNIIDLMFHKMGYLSKDYLNQVIYHIKHNRIVVFSHPWVYPLVKEHLTKEHFVVYDSHNVESYLRYTLLAENQQAFDVIKEVIDIEYELCLNAHLILCCSAEDRNLFHKFYEIDFDKMEIVPNGVFTSKIIPANREQKDILKISYFKDNKKVAIFIGSGYGPNIDAAKYIQDILAPNCLDVNFIIAGSVGNQIELKSQDNVYITGFIDDDEKLNLLQLSDFAINPMGGGSGTNIKMFDFMSAGLPIVTTKIGARGIESFGKRAFVLASLDTFIQKVNMLVSDQNLLEVMSKDARELAQEQFSFENISFKLGHMLYNRAKTIQDDIKVSIIIPSYERKELLLTLLDKLNQQEFKDFEVIVVDQSKHSIKECLSSYKYILKYIHTHIKGAVKARNFGASLANGELLGFIDDDCYPLDNRWISNAYDLYASDKSIVGIEGKVSSDHIDDPEYRSVTNVGCEGLGFMTANLFVTKYIFNKINGFDEAFDSPHFREDTDFGWRMCEEGNVPYAHNVEVFHPAHKKEIERESDEERDKFFVKDPLLMIKHPKLYEKLFLFEQHYRLRPYFWKYFKKGLDLYDIDITKYKEIYKYMPND